MTPHCQLGIFGLSAAIGVGMVQQYLGPAMGVVSLSTWSELVEAAAGGLLEESVWCELKEMATPTGTAKKDANMEMARDLASLSVDGGLLIYGVRDKDFDVVGCDTVGLADRIAQVSATRIHPPLSPTFQPALMHPDDNSLAVLVVQVPRSPLAPHMVDGSYWGRSSNGKRKLDDAEVRRLLLQRDRGEDAFLSRLTGMEARDPLVDYIEGHPTGNGHIYLVAEPCAPVVRSDEPQGSDALRQGIRPSDWPGTVPDCTYRAFDPTGEAYASIPEYNDPVQNRYERTLCHVLLKDDSSIEVVSGGGTVENETQLGRPAKFLLAGLVSALAVQTLQLVESRSLAWGYTGPWRVGLRVTKTRGTIFKTNDFFKRMPTFTADEYIKTTVVRGVDTRPLEQAQVLLKGLYRGLGIESQTVDQIAN